MTIMWRTEASSRLMSASTPGRMTLVQIGHVAHVHLQNLLDDGGLVADRLQRDGPVTPIGSLEFPREHADEVAAAERLDRIHRAAFAEVVALRNLAGVHDQHEGTLGNLLEVLDVEADRHDLLDRAAQPAAGTERVLPADHDQPAAQVADVRRQHFMLDFGQVAPPTRSTESPPSIRAGAPDRAGRLPQPPRHTRTARTPTPVSE